MKTRILLLCCILATSLCLAPPAMGAAPGCPAPEQLRPLLNSERIHACFGSYGVEVLQQAGDWRVSSLYSEEAGQRVMRTLAVTRFSQINQINPADPADQAGHPLPPDLATPLAEIRAGASLGATLEAAGWQVQKRPRYLGEIDMPASFRRLSELEQWPADARLAVQVYELWVARAELEYRVALVAELHDPRYLDLQTLRAVYPDNSASSVTPDAETAAILQLAIEFGRPAARSALH